MRGPTPLTVILLLFQSTSLSSATRWGHAFAADPFNAQSAGEVQPPNPFIGAPPIQEVGPVGPAPTFASVPQQPPNGVFGQNAPAPTAPTFQNDIKVEAAADGPGSVGGGVPTVTAVPSGVPAPVQNLATNRTARTNPDEVRAGVAQLNPDQQNSAVVVGLAVVAANLQNTTVAGTQGFGSKPCMYARTNWTCPAGYFCQIPEDSNITNGTDSDNACTAGFICPENSYQPVYCCPGFYCPTPAEIHPCPKDHWCPIGSVQPEPCSFLAICPEGSSSAQRFGVAFLFAIMFILITVFFQIRKFMVAKRNVKYNKRLTANASEREEKKVAAMEAAADKKGGSGAYAGLRDEDSDDDDDTLDMGAPTPAGPPPSRSENPSFDIAFEDVGLVLPNGIEIMHGVTGQLKAGRLCAVMGPSGAGKTTFVSLLTNKAKRTSGKIWINGTEEELSKYSKLIGFVPQEDVMLRELTVRDILMHSALMRLPSSWDAKRKKDLVLETISFLGLEHVMDQPIGNEEERGISGGQRKRVNIGMELVAAPSVLFLDEPTSGLDSATSYEVCKMLHDIAREQRMTIAAVVHSPSPVAFEQFDDLLLLGKGGRIIYFGPRNEATKYFSRLGFDARPGESPSDFYMDVATGRVPCQKTPYFKAVQLFTCWENYKQGLDPTTGLDIPSDVDVHSLPRSIQGVAPMEKGATRRSKNRKIRVKSVFQLFGHAVVDWGRAVGAYLADVGSEIGTTLRYLFTRDKIRTTPNPFTVFYLCYRRACTQLYRSPNAFLFDQIVHLLCGIFISVGTQGNDYLGLLPSRVCSFAPPVLQAGVGCGVPADSLPATGMFLSIGVLFAGVTVGSATFGRERVVFWRDVSGGMSVVPYFLAKWIADIPRIVVASLMFTGAVILFLPFRAPLYYVYGLIITLYFAAFSMGYFLSAIMKPSNVALATTGWVLLWAMLFSGVTPKLEKVEEIDFYKPVRWIWEVSAPRWSVEGWYIVEAGARPWKELQGGVKGHGYVGGRYEDCLGWVVCVGVGWAVLALLGLKLTNRQKMK
ncbi:hypothetical protein HDV00_011013 [Rhizophlyctis rosea]|nr:hypothetical protein HDV00_011013 [Rhizophlyctis rosea]